jgi:hypothetical protein
MSLRLEIFLYSLLLQRTPKGSRRTKHPGDLEGYQWVAFGIQGAEFQRTGVCWVLFSLELAPLRLLTPKS